MTDTTSKIRLDLSAATSSTEWGVMRHMYHAPSDILAVTDSREQAAADLAARLDWFGALDEPARRETGIACIELVRRTVARWPDGGRYTGPWTPDEAE